MKRDAIDFFEVRTEHQQIHDRLQNWARVVRVHQASINAPPMFKQYRSGQTGQEEEKRGDADLLDGWHVERRMRHLPEKNRKAIKWCYLSRCEPHRFIRLEQLGVTKLGLYDLVHTGRTILKNRC